MIIRVTSTLLFLLAAGSQIAAEDNRLTDEEKRDGWILLFDGETTNGWISPKGRPLDASHVQEGALNPHPCDYMLVSEQPYDDFVLSLDFKISPGCNSGVFVRTWPLTPRPGKDVGFNGIEIAIDDSAGSGFHDTGAIYDLAAPTANAMRPAGEWNRLVVTCEKARIEVAVNDQIVTQTDLDEFVEPNKRPDGSPHKFDVAYKNHPRRGHLGLQDHGNDVWFKNIKLKPLGAAERVLEEPQP